MQPSSREGGGCEHSAALYSRSPETSLSQTDAKIVNKKKLVNEGSNDDEDLYGWNK